MTTTERKAAGQIGGLSDEDFAELEQLRAQANKRDDEAEAKRKRDQLNEAAPDLLAACEFALECCQSLPGKSNHPLAVACRAAIAKAKAQ